MNGARANSSSTDMAAGGRTKSRLPRILIIVENLPVPFDRRVWQEATALKDAGYGVSVICPKSGSYPAAYEELEGIHIYRHPLPVEASGAFGYLLEYSIALFWEFYLSVKVLRQRGFDVIHACNPPDLIFLIGAVYKLFAGKRFVFDHHDINPELYETKFNRRGFFHKLMILFEKWTFRTADASLATNHVFKDIAVRRGGMPPDKVWIVRSFPDLARFRRVAPDPRLKNGRAYLAGYVGVMAKQDGVDRLIHAMHHILSVRGRTDIGCLIVGNGPEFENLKSLARDLGLDEVIHFSGFLAGDALMTHLSTIDVGVIPDPWTPYNDKISMNKVFEYMSLGIPFVQYDLTVSRETAGEAAVNVRESTPSALGDAIVGLVDAPDRRAAMSAYGRQRALETCNWDTEKQNLIAAYEFVCNRRTSDARTALRST